jgi:hypothetical protein
LLLTYAVPVLNQPEGTAGIFLTYSVLCLVGFAFVAVSVPEAKKRTIEQGGASIAKI